MTPFATPAVEAHFAAYPEQAKPHLFALRELVFQTAEQTEGVGDVEETLKWAEPAYLTPVTRSGSTIRMDWKARLPDEAGLYFHCGTRLVDTFRGWFPDEFRFDGNRALYMPLQAPLPREALGVCIATALTWHQSKRQRQATAGSG